MKIRDHGQPRQGFEYRTPFRVVQATCRRLYLMIVETERQERFKQHVWKLKDWSVSNNTLKFELLGSKTW